MIVEFIGCTGAGKTTLIKRVQRSLAKSAEVTTPFDLVAAPLGWRGVTHTTARNVFQEFVGLPFFLSSMHRHRAFILFTLKMLARQAKFNIFTLNILRSLERKLGNYEIIRRLERDRVILVDEGTVLAAHNLFVYSEAFYTQEEIATFADLAPLPDVIVYIKAPVDILLKRALQRPDPPREMKSQSPAMLELYINRAVTMFEQLTQAEKIHSRLLEVENNDLDGRLETAVNRITEFVLDYKPASLS